MSFYQIDDTELHVKNVPRADNHASFIEAKIKGFNRQVSDMEKKRQKIIKNFGESYASDIDDRILLIKHDIERERRKCMIAFQLDILIREIIDKLNVSYRYGLLTTDVHDRIEPFKETWNYSIYDFNSGSGGRLAIRRDGFQGFSYDGDILKIHVVYVFSSTRSKTVISLEWSTKKMPEPSISTEQEFSGSAFDKIKSYDEFQIAEFRHAVDEVVKVVESWYPTYKSVASFLKDEESKECDRVINAGAEALCDV